LPASIAKHDHVHVLQGGLNDDDKVKDVVSSGPKILVSFLGPVLGQNTGTVGLSTMRNPHGSLTKVFYQPVTDFYRKLFPLLVSANYQRVLILCTPSYTAHQDSPTWKWWLGIGLIKFIGGSAFKEFSGMGEFVESWPVNGENALDWTLFRVPFLMNGEAKPVVASFKGSGLDGSILNRKSMVQWMLQEIPKIDWVGRAPLLSH
jgi:hypothetical protein